MPTSIIDNEAYLCVTFRVACPDNNFMYPFVLREGNTEDPVYAWTTEANEAKVWGDLGDQEFVRVMAKYPAAETCYMAFLRPIAPRLYSRDYREYPNGAGGGYGTYMAQEERKQHGLI